MSIKNVVDLLSGDLIQLLEVDVDKFPLIDWVHTCGVIGYGESEELAIESSKNRILSYGGTHIAWREAPEISLIDGIHLVSARFSLYGVLQ